MALPVQPSDSETRRPIQLSSQERRIADAVVAAIREELQPIKDTQEEHSQILEQHSKILRNIQLEMRHINKILADADLIPDNPDL